MDYDVCIDDDSSHSCTYSDRIDSDVEAELYSIIHHQGSLTEVSKCSDYISENLSVTNDARKLMVVNESGENTNHLLRFQNQSFLENTSSNFPIKIETVPKSSAKYESDAKQNFNAGYVLSDCCEPQTMPAINSIRNPVKPCNSSPFSKKKISKCDIVDLSDSDDSVILIDADDLKGNFQVNVSSEVGIDLVANSSDSSDCALSSILQQNVNSKLASPSRKRNCSSFKDDWYIDEEDRQPFKRRSRINRELNCTNCYKKGHIARFCNAEKFFRCFICGGHHAATQCENRICSRCYNMGHDSRFCYMQLFQNCELCNMHGHKTKDCPDHWRRFHLTTKENNFIPGKPLSQDGIVYCFNCGYPGHIGSVCREHRIPRGSLVTWPCVISYQASNGSTCQAKVFIGQNRNMKFKFPKRVQDFINERKKKQEDSLINGKGKLKKWEFYKMRSIERKQKKLAVREKDFPRNPKQQDEVLTEDLPVSVKMDLLRAKKRKIRKMKQLKRKKEQRRKNRELFKEAENGFKR